MTVIRCYALEAADGQEAQLLRCLEMLGQKLVSVPGLVNARILREPERPGRCLFLETWQSPDAYQAGAALIPRELFAGLMAVLAGKPQAWTLEEAALFQPPLSATASCTP